jgi:hypothetical protein
MGALTADSRNYAQAGLRFHQRRRPGTGGFTGEDRLRRIRDVTAPRAAQALERALVC